jgi:hypothetical protein
MLIFLLLDGVCCSSGWMFVCRLGKDLFDNCSVISVSTARVVSINTMWFGSMA